MKRFNLFLVSMVTLVTLGIGFSSCGNINHKKAETNNMQEETLQTVEEQDENPQTVEEPEEIDNSDLDDSNDQVNLNSLASIQGYLSGRTFVADNGWKFKIQSGSDVYMNGNLFGTISEWYSVMTNSNNGRSYVPFNVVSPYNHAEFLFGFYPSDIIRDQEGRNYYLK